MKKEKFHRFSRTALWGIACLACGAVFGINILLLSKVAYDSTEQVSISWMPLQTIPLLAGILLLTAAISQLDQGLERINQRKLFLLLSAIDTVIALYFFLNIDPILRADAKAVHTSAQNMIAGIYTDVEKGGYLHRYPHQLGLTLYESILARFSANPLCNMIVNFLMVLHINYTCLRISEELFHNKSVNLLTMLCSFAFLPQLFFTMFVYGLIPGFFCMFSGFYQALRFAKDRKAKNLVALVLLCAGATVLKSNYSIGVLAIGIFLLLQLLKEKVSMKMVVTLVGVLLCLVVPNKLVTEYYEAKTGADLNQGTPEILWLDMGTDIDNYTCIAGWYDESVYDIYTDAGHDRQAAAQVGREKLKMNLVKIRQRPADAVKFFLIKIVSQWCDPLYQSLWSGPLEDLGQGIHSELLKSLYHDQLPGVILTVLCKFVTLMIWLGACVFLIFQGKKTEGWELFVMFFLGGLIFHTFWEGKSQYIYPYVFPLIPCAMGGIWELSQKMKRLFRQ